MAYRTLQQAANDASFPEQRADYEDMMATPEGRAKANALALLMGGAGSLAMKGASMLPSAGAGTLRQWLATQGARTAAPEAVLMEPVAGVAARDAMTQGSMMAPATAGATLMAGAPIVMAPSSSSTSQNRPSANTRVPEVLAPMDGETDERQMQSVPLPPVRDLIARAQQVTGQRQLPTNMPLPVARPGMPNQNLTSDAKPVSEQGFFARNFNQDPYAGKSASQLMSAANQDPDNAAAFFRADKALQKERPDMFQSAPTEKRGGAIKGNAAPGKDAALHKALEIIHHLLTRGH
jgi:hypothetical protein